ncbi:MAG: VWA domain-containing protein [Coraliomargarita sp.]
MVEFHFIRPLWLLAFLPALFIWIGLWRKASSLGNLAEVVDAHLLEHLLVDAESTRGFRPVHLLGILWVLAVLALAGPSWKQEPSPFADEQAGLFVLLRVSPTMKATDLQPTRLERARHKLSDLLELREGAATGLIAYNGSAHLVMPLTRDTRILSSMAESLSPEIMPREGDALSEAIALAQSHFERAQMPGSILVITDEITDSRSVDSKLPIQIFALHTPNSALPSDIQAQARQLGASVTSFQFEPSDVETIQRRARSDFSETTLAGEGARWQDAGYAILPVIALCSLAFFRRGWSQ